jgi:hypothetical protein
MPYSSRDKGAFQATFFIATDIIYTLGRAGGQDKSESRSPSLSGRLSSNVVIFPNNAINLGSGEPDHLVTGIDERSRQHEYSIFQYRVLGQSALE